MKSLVPDWEYKLFIRTKPEGILQMLTTVTVKSGESVDLGDIAKPAPRKPYVPPTLDERIQVDFDVKGTPLERHQKALELIQLVNQNLLVVFGEPVDRTIRSLMDIRYNDREFRPLRDDFRFMAIPTDEQRLHTANSLANKLGEELTGANQKFRLVILDPTGTKIASAGSDQLCVEDELSKERLIEFFRQHQTKPLDARKLLDEALQQAAKENKRVLVQETATWCGPCHLLSRLLKSNRVWEQDLIWIKMDHRWTGAEELMTEIRDGAEGGIPWFAILDAQGKKLATSNDPESGDNIGFPSEASGKTHFANMLNCVRQNMTKADVESLIESIDTLD